MAKESPAAAVVKYVRDDDNAVLFPQTSQKRRRHGFALCRFGQEPRHCDTGVDDDTHQKNPSSLDWRSISTAQSPPASLVL